MTTIETELPPLTTEQREAIRACRFSYTTVTRDHAWLIFTADDDLVRRLGDLARKTATYTRDHVTGTRETEVLVGHPEAVELVLQIEERRRHV